MDNANWGHLLGRLMEHDCVYRPTNSTVYTYQRRPSPTARHYLVLAQAHVPNEADADYHRRTALTRFTLQRLREQMGDSLEMTVVELFDASLPPSLYPYADTVISNTHKEGQDWGMYQDGIQHVAHRLEQWDSITVMNDQMVGPLHPLSHSAGRGVPQGRVLRDLLLARLLHPRLLPLLLAPPHRHRQVAAGTGGRWPSPVTRSALW